MTADIYADDDDNIIDLFRSVDEDGNEYWAVSNDEKMVALREPIGKKQIPNVVNQKNTADGWPIPFPSTPRKPKEEGGKVCEIKYDFNFMAHGEDVEALYSEPYSEKNPTICVRKRTYNVNDISQNGWISNLKTSPKSPKNGDSSNNECDSDDASNRTTENTQVEDGVLAITFMYEPHTGRKYFCISPNSNQCSMAECLKDLVENKYPQAEQLNLVMCEDDFEQVHSLALLYSADEGLDIYLKLNTHIVPNKARWLNFAENEAIVVGRQCLNDKVSSLEQLENHLSCWQQHRTYVESKINLQKIRRVFSDVYKPIVACKPEAP